MIQIHLLTARSNHQLQAHPQRKVMDSNLSRINKIHYQRKLQYRTLENNVSQGVMLLARFQFKPRL